ncbi:MAG: YcgN family cysteine cluster protein [Alphaproteobacteria bacterium]|nr:YcgN family cysteine cluster protein [Alphaproteobacteria bacterium]
MTDKPFWKTKGLSEMTGEEWESLCDGCAKCCLVKLEDEDTAAVIYTGLHCKLLNAATCLCSDYPNRKTYVPDCIKLTPDSIRGYDWLPFTCAYRLIDERKDLPDWHHLVCGDREEVHRRGVSAKGKTVSEVDVAEDDAIEHIADWANRHPDEYPRKSRKRR